MGAATALMIREMQRFSAEIEAFRREVRQEFGAMLGRVEQKQDTLLEHVIRLEQRSQTMAKELDDLTAEVAGTKAGVDSAVTLIAGLRQQIIDAGTDPAKLQALTDSLKASEAELAGAVATPGTADAKASPPSP